MQYKANFQYLLKYFTSLSTAKGGAQAITLLAIPFITALYAPATIGFASSMIGIVGIVASGGSLGYQFAIPIVENEEEVKYLIKFIAYLSAFVGILFFVGMFLYLRSNEKWFFVSASLSVFTWLKIKSATEIQTIIRQKKYNDIALSSFLFPAVTYPTAVFIGIFSSTVTSYLLAFVIGGMFQCLYLLHIRNKFLKYEKTTRTSLLKVLCRYKKFPLFSSPTALLNAAGGNLPVVLTAYFFSAEKAGFFTMAERLALAPINLLGESFSHIYVGEMAEAIRTDHTRVINIFVFALMVGTMISIPVALLIYLLSDFIVGLFFSAGWEETSTVLSWLSILILFRLIARSVGRIFSILERQEVALYWNVARTLGVITIFFFAYNAGIKFLEVIALYVLLSSIFDILLLFLAYRTCSNWSS